MKIVLGLLSGFVLFSVALPCARTAHAEPEPPRVTREPLFADCGTPCEPAPPCECYRCTCRKPPEPKCPPAYENLRFRENWKPCLCVPLCERGDWTDQLKARRFGTSWFRLDVGGQVRFRAESFVSEGFVDGNNDTWLLGRLRLHTDMHVLDHFRVFVEGIYADQWTRAAGPRPIDVNEGDLLNVFAEIHGNLGRYEMGIAGGRREMQFGAQRLISPLDWSNTRRTFEGGYGWVRRGQHKVDLFWTHPVIVDRYEFDEGNEDVDFYGVYYENRVWTCLDADLYVLGLDREAAAYQRATAEETRYTVGARIKGDVPSTRLGYEVEGGYQFGDFGDDDISAGFATAYVGWKPCRCPWDPEILVGVDWASGDSGSGTLGTFNQLYPLGHAYLGFADLIGRQNVLSPHVTLIVKPIEDAKKLSVRLDYMAFWRDSAKDAVYNAAGRVLRAPTSDELFTGQELDVSLSYQVDRHWRLAVGWAHVFAGAFLEETGPADDIDFVWAELQWSF